MRAITLKELKDVVKSYKDKRVLLTFHSIGDTDSVSSAFALLKYFKNGRIATPDFITSNSRRIIEHLGFSQGLITKGFDQSADLVILLDVNNFGDCGSFGKKLEGFSGAILIIDHHAPNKIDKPNVIAFNDESHNSTASIVYELIKSLGIIVDKKLANLIATGIISDSAEFKNAFPKTFIQIGELLDKSGMDYPSMLLEMHHIADVETRKEFIEELFESNITIINDMLILHGAAKIHANKLADDAIRIGADASIFYSTTKKEVSFSARLRPPLEKDYKLHMGALMKELAPIINGQGGGHPGAAGAYGPNISSRKKFLDRFMSEIKRRTDKG